MGMKGVMICASQLWGSAMHVSTEHSTCTDTQRFIVVSHFFYVFFFPFLPAIFYLRRDENLFLATRWRKQAFYSIWIKQEAKSSWPKYYRHLRERWFFFSFLFFRTSHSINRGSGDMSGEFLSSSQWNVWVLSVVLPRGTRFYPGRSPQFSFPAPSHPLCPNLFFKTVYFRLKYSLLTLLG